MWLFLINRCEAKSLDNREKLFFFCDLEGNEETVGFQSGLFSNCWQYFESRGTLL